MRSFGKVSGVLQFWRVDLLWELKRKVNPKNLVQNYTDNIKIGQGGHKKV